MSNQIEHSPSSRIRALPCTYALVKCGSARTRVSKYVKKAEVMEYVAGVQE